MTDISEYVRARSGITDRVKASIVKTVQLEMDPRDIDNDAHLFGMGIGLDSIDAIDLLLTLEQEFLVRLEDNHDVFRSVNTIVDFLIPMVTAHSREQSESTPL